MKKATFFLTFFVGSFLFITACSTICSAQIKDLQQFFKDEYPKYKLLHFQRGNFTGLGDQEYIVFYEDPKRVNIDHPSLRNIDKVAVFSLKKRFLLNKYEMENVWSFGYDDKHLRIIRKLKICKQDWNGFCFVGDFNNNGRDEVLFFILTGLSFNMDILEFRDNQFKPVLEYPSFTSLSNIEAKADGKRETFTIYDGGGGNTPKGKRNWYLLKWNEKTNKYAVVKQGVQDWYDPRTGGIINE